jgi:hypothetical protein
MVIKTQPVAREYRIPGFVSLLAKRTVRVLKDLPLFLSLCTARYIVWREMRRRRK